MSNGKGQAVGEREPKVKVQVLIGLAERTPAWQKLMRRLLSPPPCEDPALALHFGQKDGGRGDA